MKPKYTLKDLELPDDEPMVIIRSSMLWMCDDDKYAAAALNMYIHWTKWLMKHELVSTHISNMIPNKTKYGFQETSIIIYRNQNNLIADLLGFCSDKKLRAVNALLVSKGLLKIDEAPRHKVDHTLKYEVQIEKFQTLLAEWQKIRGDIEIENGQPNENLDLEQPPERLSEPARPISNRIKEMKSMPYAEYLLTPEWAKKRQQALRFAGFRCQLCNSAKDLNVHHRSYERLGHERLNDLTTLCNSCHAIFHANEEGM